MGLEPVRDGRIGLVSGQAVAIDGRQGRGLIAIEREAHVAGDLRQARPPRHGANLGKLRAIVQQVPNLTAASDYLFTLARERDWHRVAWHPHPLIEPLLAGVPCATDRVDAADFDKNTLESCDAGITSCETLVAQTGSILVSSATSGGRALSILPHVHVIVATVDQIVATLADALSPQGRGSHAGRVACYDRGHDTAPLPCLSG
ncbi:MAG: LUD domain-containing protein [Planctomycetota bacterium]